MKISPPPGFDPRPIQPVASSYTDYAIPAPPVGKYWCLDGRYSLRLQVQAVQEQWLIGLLDPEDEDTTTRHNNPEDLYIG